MAQFLSDGQRMLNEVSRPILLVLQHEMGGFMFDLSERLRVLAIPHQVEMFREADDTEETIAAAAKRTGVKLWRLYQATSVKRSGEPDALPCVRRGRSVTVRRRALAEWLDRTDKK